MNKQMITTPNAPAAIGPYSQAVKTGLVVFLSGQIGLDPATQSLAGDDFGAQARQAFRNLEAVARASGGSLAHVVKLTLFLTDLSKFGQGNDIMLEMMAKAFPARSTVGVGSQPRRADVGGQAIPWVLARA